MIIANGKYAYKTIKVIDEPETMEFRDDVFYMPLDSEWNLWNNYPRWLDVSPSTAADYPVTVEIEDEDVLVYEDGVFISLSEGETKVTVSTEKLSASAKVIVGNYADYIYTDGEYDIYANPGDQIQLEYKLYPQGGDFTDEVITWAAQPVMETGKTLKVSQSGQVTVTEENYGRNIVFAKLKNGRSASWTVNVAENPHSLSFAKDEYYVTEGALQTITVKTDSDHAKHANYKWSMADNTVAYLWGNYDQAEVRFKAEGETTLRVELANDPEVYAECKIISQKPVPATAIKVNDVTGYAGYSMLVPIEFEPGGASHDITCEFSNDNVEEGGVFAGDLSLICLKAGTTDVTVKAADSDASATFRLTILDEAPDQDLNYAIYPYISKSEYDYGNSVINPDTYTFILGKKYQIQIENFVSSEYKYSMIDFNKTVRDAFNGTDLLTHALGGAASGDLGQGANFSVTAVKPGTDEIEIVKGKKIRIAVVDYAQKDSEITFDQSVDERIKTAISADNTLGLSDAMRMAAAEIAVPADLVLGENEKPVVQTKLDVNVLKFEKTENGNVLLNLDISPKYRIVAVGSDAAADAEGRELVSEQNLPISKSSEVRIPVGNALEGMDISRIRITHIKEDGTKYVYYGKLEDNAIIFENPNGFSEFDIEVIQKPVLHYH